jgi:hypothetical protein
MSFNDKWSTFHNNWRMYQPNVSKIYQINVFDDGNHKFKNYSNQWYMQGEWKSKVSLVNKYDNDIQICSISNWKINLIN